jgi:acyl-CoA reductase-like NAD-dependent aldehyde dehydrogenase
MIVREQLFIDGSWQEPAGRQAVSVTDCATEEPMGSVPAGALEDVERAVAAARRAIDVWRDWPVAERAMALEQIASGLEARRDELAVLIAREVGTPVTTGLITQVDMPITLLRNAAALVREYAFEEQVATSVVVNEPVGVVACITPWNFPLSQVVSKVASALAVGCPVIVKPSSEAPLSLFVLADVVADAGVPRGMFNVVSGSGAVLGEALARHPDVDMISFTGSTEVGRMIGELAAHTVKRVALELGGKSPNVILDDIDVERAMRDGLARSLLNSGQTCSALTRMLVPADQLHDYEEAARALISEYPVGAPLEKETKLGPLVSAAQRDSVRAYIGAGVSEGATLVTGGADAPAGFERGYYVRPTVFSAPNNDIAIAREEIFGPVLTIIPYADEADAVRMANDTIYGLAAGVWSGDRDRAEAIARRLRAGQVHVNGPAFNPLAPFGGYKQSGYGRERGRFGLDEFLEIKSLQF